MGNHSIGRAMVVAAELAIKMRTTQSALELLDAACEQGRGADAEFDDDSSPESALGLLITEAFGERGRDYTSSDEAELDWLDGPWTQFRKRYELC